MSIMLLLFVGVKRVFLFTQKWLVERAIGNVHMTSDDNVHQISVWVPSVAKALYYYN